MKSISTRYLAFGILISFLTIGISCKKNVSWIMHGEFHYVNSTDHSITYQIAGSERYSLSPKSIVVIKQTQDSDKEVKPEYYHSPMIELGIKNSFIVKFDNSKCWEALNSVHNPLEIKNYASEKLGDRTYKFTYTFLEEDYQRATDCP